MTEEENSDSTIATNELANELANEPAIGNTFELANDYTNERVNDSANERVNEDINKHANERADERATIADDKDTTTTVVTEGGSFGLTTASGNKAELCEESNLALGGQTYVVVLNALNRSGVLVKNIVTLTWFCPETALQRQCFRGGNF